MADNDFYIQGIPECIANLQKYTREIRERIAAAFVVEANRILAIAKSRTPVRSGALRDSGRVSGVSITPDEISIAISFGDEVVHWAISVHERTQVRHISGRSKFLESVILEEMNNVLQNIANAIRL